MPERKPLRPLSQARMLRRRISQAKTLLTLSADEKGLLSEPEVTFRFDALEGILTIALADALQMVREWTE